MYTEHTYTHTQSIGTYMRIYTYACVRNLTLVLPNPTGLLRLYLRYESRLQLSTVFFTVRGLLTVALKMLIRPCFLGGKRCSGEKTASHVFLSQAPSPASHALAAGLGRCYFLTRLLQRKGSRVEVNCHMAQIARQLEAMLSVPSQHALLPIFILFSLHL